MEVGIKTLPTGQIRIVIDSECEEFDQLKDEICFRGGPKFDEMIDLIDRA